MTLSDIYVSIHRIPDELPPSCDVRGLHAGDGPFCVMWTDRDLVTGKGIACFLDSDGCKRKHLVEHLRLVIPKD